MRHQDSITTLRFQKTKPIFSPLQAKFSDRLLGFEKINHDLNHIKYWMGVN